MLKWIFQHINRLGFFIGITGAAGFIGLKIWRYCHRYPNLFQKLIQQPPEAPQAGVHYPPPAAGIEVKSLKGFWVTYIGLPKSIKLAREMKMILAPHLELLKWIEMATETANVFEERYWPAIERYARLVHLLPASASDHHCLQGGLLHHGLQTGFNALQYAQDGLYGMNLGEKKRDGRERWLFGAFIAGLCHDAGKVVTDVQVSTGQGGLVWPSSSERLLDWAIKNRVSKYYVDWKPNRYKLHEKVAPQMLDEVLTKNDIEYLQKIDKGLYEELLKTLADVSDSSADNPFSKYPDNLREMVRKADKQSVQEDLKKSRSPADLGIETATPLVRYYRDAIRQLFKEGKWSLNKSGGAAWVLGRGRKLYLVWPRCGLELYDFLLGAGIQGVPKDPDVIAESLARWQVIETAPGGGLYWRIKPGEIVGENAAKAQIPLTVIRFKDNWASDLAGLLPPGLGGMVEAEEEGSLSWKPVEASPEKEADMEKLGNSGPMMPSSPVSPGANERKDPIPLPVENQMPAFTAKAKSEKAVDTFTWKGRWEKVLIGFTCLSLGFWGSIFYYLHLKRNLDPDFPYPFFLRDIVGQMFTGDHIMWLGVIAIMIPIGIKRYLWCKYEFDEKEKQADETLKKAEEAIAEAEQKVLQIEGDGRRKAGEIEKEANNKAADIRAAAEDDAKAIKNRAEEEADREKAGKKSAAEEEAAGILARAKKQANDYAQSIWNALQGEALNQGVPLDKITEMVTFLQKAEKAAEVIRERAKSEAQAEADAIIAEAKAKAEEIKKQAKERGDQEAEESIKKANIHIASIYRQALKADGEIAGQGHEIPEAGERGEKSQGAAQVDGDQPFQKDLPGLNDPDQEVEQVQVAALEEKIWRIISEEHEIKKRDLERRVNKSRYERYWELALSNLLASGKIIYDPESNTYICQQEYFQ